MVGSTIHVWAHGDLSEQAGIRKVGPQVILVNNLYVASEVGLYGFNYINLSNFNWIAVDIKTVHQEGWPKGY